MDLRSYLLNCQMRVNHILRKVLPESNKTPRKLHEAMRYSVLNGGKRIRSAFLYATGEGLGGNKEVLDFASAAVELIHAFSLIHDDLPAIDNDDLRHGQLSCHKAFGEGIALLAGDSLLTLAFEVLSKIDSSQISPQVNLAMIRLLTRYIGSRGMAGGEALDIEANPNISLEEVAKIYKLKTSYLICASVMLGALCANCTDPAILSRLEKYGLYLGLAFQIHDDILGLETDTAILGKPQFSDLKKNKSTYPNIVGISNAKIQEKNYLNAALESLKNIKMDHSILIALGQFVIDRKF